MSIEFSQQLDESDARLLSIRDVASWQFPQILTEEEREQRLATFRPGIPSLQRGAVWKPRQTEFLWDSLMRGFPIGSFVVCNRIADQKEHGGKFARNDVSVPFTHHMLDGQQRSDAIALGFLDPLDFSLPDPSALLWIDLKPVRLSESRRFLFRITTKAHPWGYADDEECSKLDVSAIRLALGNHDSKDPRPGPIDMRPWKAGAPIPFAWLIDGVAQGLCGGNLWEHVAAKIQAFGLRNSRFKRVEFPPFDGDHLKAIEDGICRALSSRLVALGVPSRVLLEEGGSKQTNDGIEHLFQRLNSAGTRLEGADLAYSMIKAYWPGIETVLDGLNTCPASFARLADFGFRLSSLVELTDIPGSLGVSRIRSLAKSGDDALKPYREYLGLREVVVDEKIPFVQDLEQVDKWLLWREPGDIGVPPAVRMEMVKGNPDLYLCLLRLARIGRELSLDMQEADLRKRIVGVAMAIHWFCPSIDSAKRFAAERVLAYVLRNNGVFSADSFRGVLSVCVREGERKGISQILTTPELNRLLPSIPGEETLQKWRMWEIVVRPNEEGRAEREQESWPFVSSLIYNRNLLLYCQRDFLGSRWSQYDKATPDMWEDHNRPWDYDHILPKAVLYNRRCVTFKEAADEWLNTIGNYRAWPLEENRSKRDQKASETITGADIEYSFLLDADEVAQFSLGTDDFFDATKAAAFMNAARSRMFRMYRGWFETLQIGALLGSADPSNPEASKDGE